MKSFFSKKFLLLLTTKQFQLKLFSMHCISP